MLYKSPAKVNLFLQVYGIDSGYHLLDSALTFLDLHDEIKFTAHNCLEINVEGQYSHLINLKDNIFTKILYFFRDKYVIDGKIKIDLVKNIPIGGGLGGGSSNGAMLMKFLNKHYRLGFDNKKLQEISFEFGSDIAFFLQDHASFIKNRGEVCVKLKKFDDIEVVLIIPPFGLSTAQVFANYDRNFSDEGNFYQLEAMELLKNQRNDLVSAALATNSELKNILQQIEDCNQVDVVKMSGTGSTLFAIAKEGNVDELFTSISSKLPSCKIIKSKIKWSHE